MPKYEKVKVNVKERVEDNICDLSLSELNEVPVREIVSFKRVTTLDLSSNKLQNLGKQFCTLTRLVKLDLSQNEIKYLPDDFGLLRNLRHLDLYDNKLEHLPLSFGDLTNLRYLDLKDNPLTPALSKIVGFCLTTKECQDSARNTVKFLAQMQIEACKAKQEFRDQLQKIVSNNDSEQQNQLSTNTKSLEMPQQKQTKKSNKKTKSKQKKSNNNNEDTLASTTTNNVNSNGAGTKNKTSNTSNNNNKQKIKKSSPSATSSSTSTSATTNGGLLKKPKTNSMAALTTIFTFLSLLAINIVIIYMIMFKNPEIADKLVEIIPHQYRDWILTKTEIFRLRVTDWISEFRTPPEEN